MSTVPGSGSGVPYYLAANVDNAPTLTDIFNIKVTTTLPQDVNWNPPSTSIWEEVSTNLSSAYTTTKESVGSVLGTGKELFVDGVSNTWDLATSPFWMMLKGMGIMVFLTVAGIATAVWFALQG